MVLGPLLALVVAIAVPVLFGLMIYDAIKSPASEPTISEITEAERVRAELEAAGRRIQVERGVARAFVILGGVFWGIATFAGLYWYRETGVGAAALAAGAPLLASLVTLVIGWYWERAAAILLVLASLAVIYWGVITGFELGVWGLMTVALIGPMMTAGALYWLARGEYVALTLRIQTLELAPIPVESSVY